MRPKPDPGKNYLRLKGEGGNHEKIHDITDLGGAWVFGPRGCHRPDGAHYYQGNGKRRSAMPEQMPGGLPHFVEPQIRARTRGASLVLSISPGLPPVTMPNRLDYPDGMYPKRHGRVASR